VNTERNAENYEKGDTHFVTSRGFYGLGTYFGVPFRRNQPSTNRPWGLESRPTQPENNLFATLDLRDWANYFAQWFGRRISYYKPASEDLRAWEEESKRRQGAVMMAALRRDTVTNMSYIMGKNDEENLKGFVTWVNGVNNDFQQRFGVPAPDLGIAAAMLGYDAYFVPPSMTNALRGGETVVLNRGKTIVTTPYKQKNYTTNSGVDTNEVMRTFESLARREQKVTRENMQGIRRPR